MKKLKFLTVAVIACGLSFLFSCGGGGGGGDATPAPVADFRIVTEEAERKVGALIFVEFTGKNAKSYEWDFGNGGEKKINKIDTVVYSQSGTYTITLTAYSQSGRKGASATKSRQITIAPGNRIAFKKLTLYPAYSYTLGERKKSTNVDPRLRVGYAEPSLSDPNLFNVQFIHKGEPVVASSIADSIVFELSGSISPIAMKQLNSFICIADIPTSGQGTILSSIFRYSVEPQTLDQIINEAPATNLIRVYSYTTSSSIPPQYQGQRAFSIMYDIIEAP